MILYMWFSVRNCLARVKKRWKLIGSIRYCILLILWEFWDWVGACDTFHVAVIWWSQSCMMILCIDGVLLIFNFECMMMVLFLIWNMYVRICLLLLWRVPFGFFFFYHALHTWWISYTMTLLCLLCSCYVVLWCLWYGCYFARWGWIMEHMERTWGSCTMDVGTQSYHICTLFLYFWNEIICTINLGVLFYFKT